MSQSGASQDRSSANSRPLPRRLPAVPQQDMCVASLTTFPETFPFYQRRDLATVRLQQVEQIGQAKLYCDCLHEGFHEWPPALQPITIASPDDRVDKGDELV